MPSAAIRHSERSASTGPRPAASASSCIAAWPSKAVTSRTPRRAAAASNQRPADVVGGEFVPWSSISRHDGRARPREAGRDLGAASERVQHGRRHAPGLPRRAVPAGEPQLAQVAQPLEARAVDAQQLAAPGRAVGAQPDAVERQADRRRGVAVLRADRRDVGMVVLDGERGNAALRREPGREAAGVEIGMQVVGAGPRLHLQDGEEVLHRLVQRLAGRRVVEVADVRRQERLVAARHADGVLEPGARGEDRRAGTRQADGARRVAAGAPHEGGPAGRGADHAVVAAGGDVAVVHHVGIRDAGEPPHRLVVADHERLAARVGARHDEHELLRPRRARPSRRARRSPRGRGATAAACTAASRPASRRRWRCRRAPRRSPDASRGGRWAARAIRAAAARPRPRARREAGEATFAAITAKGFSSRSLEARSRATARTLRASQTRWKPPRPFTATTLPARIFSRAAAITSSTLRRVPSSPRRAIARPAHGAGVGLRVEAAVGGVVVLALARRAHREGRHRRERPVVGDAPRDGEARAAVRAVDERIAEAAVARREELREAVGAGGRVGRHRRRGPAALARGDGEALRRVPPAAPPARRRSPARAAALRIAGGAGTRPARAVLPALPRARLPRR